MSDREYRDLGTLFDDEVDRAQHPDRRGPSISVVDLSKPDPKWREATPPVGTTSWWQRFLLWVYTRICRGR